MIKNILRITILFFAGFGFSQSNQQQISLELPNLSPQTPTTADLGKYGELQVNESSGTVSQSIPLFEYYAGKMNLPLSLNYSGNGVRVNQDPTWAGINWNINPAGVITRVVKDEIDELTPVNKRLFYSKEELDALPGKSQLLEGELGQQYGYFDTTTLWWQTIKKFTEEDIDNEADIFNYNFLGYSGSFYLDTENEVHLIKYDKELKITFSLGTNNKSSFTIKTPDGNTYFFGGPNASESSRSWSNNGSGSTKSSDFAQNAFYLYHISFFDGGAITFEYEQYGESNCMNKIGIQENAVVKNNGYCEKKYLTLYSEIQSVIKLKKIISTFNNQYVEFDTSVINACAGIYKLNSIVLKDVNHQLIKKVGLYYTTIDTESESFRNKFFLTDVKFFDKNNTFVNSYELLYDSLELLPSRNSFAQDELGYYNGKNSNTTLLPLVENYPWVNTWCYNLADREASFVHSKIGSLKEIKYPTKGYTSFEYELPYKGQKQVYESHYIVARYSDPNSNNESSNHSYNNNIHSYSNLYDPTVDDNGILLTQATEISFNLSIAASGSFTQQNNVLFSVIKTDSGNATVWTNDPSGTNGANGFSLSTDDNELKNYTNYHTFTLQPGRYKFKVSINLNGSVCTCQNSTEDHPIDNDNYVVANAQLYLPNGFRDVYYPGLRVKRGKSFDNNNNEQVTRFYYNNLEHLNEESVIYRSNFISITLGLPISAGQTAFSGSSGANPALTDYVNINTNSVNNLSISPYSFITVSYGGDNFENGGKEMSYYNYSDTWPLFYDLGTQNYITWNSQYEFHNFIDVGTNDYSYQNSVLQKERIFNNQQRILKQTDYNYQGTQNTLMNNVRSYFFAPRSNPFISNYVYMLYKTISTKYRLISSSTKEFFEPSKIVETFVTNSYANSKVSLPNSITTSTSAGETKTLNLFYPSDASLIGDLTSQEIANLSVLESSKHKVSQVVKVENLLNGVVLDSRQVSFGDFQGNILPSLVKSKKGTNSIEDRVEFHSYTFQGSPTLVSLRNGTKIRYVYNTKNQVVLKIENADSAIVIDDNVNPNTTPCYYQNQYPQAMVTQYIYDPNTNNLISIVDPKCDSITYEYDNFNRLKAVYDRDGNKLSENQYHFKF